MGLVKSDSSSSETSPENDRMSSEDNDGDMARGEIGNGDNASSGFCNIARNGEWFVSASLPPLYSDLSGWRRRMNQYQTKNPSDKKTTTRTTATIMINSAESDELDDVSASLSLLVSVDEATVAPSRRITIDWTGNPAL